MAVLTNEAALAAHAAQVEREGSREAPTSLALGCNYAGHEFGAHYPDSVCIDGYLWDADSEEGGLLTSGGEWPCPRCNTREYLQDAVREAQEGGCGVSNGWRWVAAVIWERSCEKALRENREAAAQFLAALEPFETEDWPDRQAVAAGRASWDNTVTVMAHIPTQQEGEL